MKKVFHYMIRVFGINAEVNKLTDKREKNRSIELRTVVLTVIVGFILNQPSFNSIFAYKSFRRRTKNMFAKGTKQAKKDAARAIIQSLDTEELKSINGNIVDKVRRNKVFRNGTIDGLVVAAIDGVE